LLLLRTLVVIVVLGLSAALFLRWHGVDVLAVERHAGTAINARAGHFHLRTVEILRSAGLEDAVKCAEDAALEDGGLGEQEVAGMSIAAVALGSLEPHARAHGLITVARRGRPFTEDDREVLRSLGAEAVIDPAQEKLFDRVMALTAGHGVDHPDDLVVVVVELLHRPVQQVGRPGPEKSAHRGIDLLNTAAPG